MPEEKSLTILTTKEACEFLKVSRVYIYQHIHEIPHYKVDHMLRFAKEKLIEWLEGKER